jgi:aryl-alcohol dehydrogenase-like predicted oxidoreductase
MVDKTPKETLANPVPSPSFTHRPVPGQPVVPTIILGRSGLVSSRLGLGFGGWSAGHNLEQLAEVLSYAFEIGIRHLDVAPLYGTEEILGRALKNIDTPPDLVLATKACSYRDDLKIVYREYSDRTVYRSVERSLKRLQVERLSIVHIHDCEPQDLPQVFARNGALKALSDLKEQGVIASIGMATFSVECLQAAIASEVVDQIQS